MAAQIALLFGAHRIILGFSLQQKFSINSNRNKTQVYFPLSAVCAAH
jgi:hypothetical protein